MLAFLGFAMIGVLVYFLLTEKISPMPTFIIIPCVAGSLALLMQIYIMPSLTGAEVPLTKAGEAIQFMPSMIDYVKSGLATTMPIAVMFIFSILYFGLMNDAGMFEPLVNFLAKKAGNNVALVTVASCLIAIVTHLDGALASTLLITIPAMLPLYKKLNMRPVVLLAIIGSAMSIMNLLPWGGPTARSAAILKMDVNQMWLPLIPVQITGLVIAVAFAAYLGFVERARGAGYNANINLADVGAVGNETKNEKSGKYSRPHLVWVNILLTACVIGLLIAFPKLPAYAPFMLGTALALVINYNAKEQMALIKAHASNALSVPAILLASGVFLGVIANTGMLNAMATAMISIIPDFLGRYLHIIMGVTAVPVGMLLGTDSYFFGLLPLAIDVGKQYGIEPRTMVDAMLIGKNYGVLVTPHAATTFLAIGLAGVSLRELFLFCVPRLWLLSLGSLGAAVAIGLVPL